MSKIIFAGITLMGADEGNFSYMPGVIGRDREFIKLGRAEGLISKDLGSGGADHGILMRFYAVTDFADVLARLQNACEREDGTLWLTGYGNIYNCVVMDKPQLSEGRSSAKVDGTSRGYAFAVNMRFVQLS